MEIGNRNKNSPSFDEPRVETRERLNPQDFNFRDQDLQGKRIYVTHFLVDDTAELLNYRSFFNVPQKCTVLGAWESHEVPASTSGTTVTLVKLTAGQSVISGTNVLAEEIELTTTARTPVFYKPSADPSANTLDAGDRLGVTLGADSPTGMGDFLLTVELLLHS